MTIENEGFPHWKFFIVDKLINDVCLKMTEVSEKLQKIAFLLWRKKIKLLYHTFSIKIKKKIRFRKLAVGNFIP